MALIKNDNGQWAWVTDAAETPKRFFATKDEALKHVNADDTGATRDSADRCYTVERGTFVG